MLIDLNNLFNYLKGNSSPLTKRARVWLAISYKCKPSVWGFQSKLSISVSIERISFPFIPFFFPYCVIIISYNGRELFFLTLKHTLMYNCIPKQVKYPAWGSLWPWWHCMRGQLHCLFWNPHLLLLVSGKLLLYHTASLSDFMTYANSNKLPNYATIYFTNLFFKRIVLKGVECNYHSQT